MHWRWILCWECTFLPIDQNHLYATWAATLGDLVDILLWNSAYPINHHHKIQNYSHFHKKLVSVLFTMIAILVQTITNSCSFWTTHWFMSTGIDVTTLLMSWGSCTGSDLWIYRLNIPKKNPNGLTLGDKQTQWFSHAKWSDYYWILPLVNLLIHL